MKTLLLCLLLLACSEQEKIEPANGLGCQTGLIPGTSTRILLRCCTYKQHLAGENVAAGGLSEFALYDKVQWQAVDDCKNCN